MTAATQSYLKRFRKHPLFNHLLGWSFFIFYEVFFLTVLLGIPQRHSVLLEYTLAYALNIGLFYFHAGVTLPESFGSRRNSWFLFIFLLTVELIVYVFCMNLVNSLHGANWRFPSGHTLTDYQPMLTELWRGIYFLGFSTAYWRVKRSSEYQKRLLEMEKMQLINVAQKSRLERNLVETENAWLRSQINPHLLFNTLNFIYNNVQQVSAKASEAILLLSELMNYSLREPEADGKTSLGREMKQILNLIRINQIRFENRLFLDVEIEGEYEDVRIIPLLIVVFVENVFKHGDLTDEEMPGRIAITYEDQCLQLFTVNKKKRRSHTESHGIGLVNIRKRLDKEYADRYRMDVRNSETQYYLHLSINLDPQND